MTTATTTTHAADADLFQGRPVRTRTCRSCGGRGQETIPYWLAPATSLPGAPDGAVLATVVGTASIFEATREAADLARASGRSVALEFNRRLVVVGPDDSPHQVARRWWIAEYGKTPEESLAER